MVFNRRNALVGWLVLTLGKRVLKRKAKAARPDVGPAVEPDVDSAARRPTRKAIALLGAGAGAAAVWHKRSRGGGEPPA